MNPTGIEAQVCADIAARQARGIAKYGTTVADNPLTLNEWLQHAYEEALDMAVYLKRAMAGPTADYRSPGIRVTQEPAVGAEPLTDAARDVLAERHRQISVEGWTPERDDSYRDCQLAAAAATYALCERPEQLKVCGIVAWPWRLHWWKPTGYRRNLVKAGALILAEIERLDRAASAKGDKQ